MALDPARFIVADCVKGRMIQANNTAQAKGFLSAVAKIGDLGVLNDVGFGKVRNGLNVLTQVSNSIRIGQSVVPGQQGNPLYNSSLAKIASIAATSVDNGANAVLDITGIGASAVSAVNAINPGAANIAYGQAKNIFQTVKQGGFTVNMIPGVFQDLQNLQMIASKIFTLGNPPAAQQIIHCQASPYAVDLIARAPKNKFMFVLQFIFNTPYSNQFDEYGRGTAFVVKQSTRPNIEFEYEEVNMYNYRTRIPKRTIYQPMTMTFYDDNTNNVTNFYNAYLQAHSPIANMGGSINSNGTVNPSSAPLPSAYQLDSMNDALGSVSSASYGPLQNDNITFIQQVRLFHIYNYGNAMTVYSFFNPKITRLAPDDLTMMESGNGSEMQFEFAYDGLYVVPEYDLTNKSPYNITTLTSGGLYPIVPVFAQTNTSVNLNASQTDVTGSGVIGTNVSSNTSVSGLQAAANAAENKLNFDRSSHAPSSVIAVDAEAAANAQFALATGLEQQAGQVQQQASRFL